MEVKRSCQVLVWTILTALLSQNLFLLVVSSPASFENQKNFFTPYPYASPPPVTYNPPPYSSGGGHASPTPSHGTPSHGGGSHGGTPPANCGRPPSEGHHYTSPPSSGGGYHHPSPTSKPTPTRPTTPTPTYRAPPTTTPGITMPSPPFAFDPNSPPFTCNYWRSHPTLILGLFGWLGTVGSAIGGSIPATGADMNLLEALSNTRTDGLGELYREGTAALLNSMAHTGFPYSSNQVRDSFVRALSSDKAAAAQAQLFQMANEGRMSPRT